MVSTKRPSISESLISDSEDDGTSSNQWNYIEKCIADFYLICERTLMKTQGHTE